MGSFRYRAFQDCELIGFVARAIRLYEQGPGEADASARLGLYVERWARWVRAGLVVPSEQGLVAAGAAGPEFLPLAVCDGLGPACAVNMIRSYGRMKLA